jgi:DNA-binding HxlR family transcriptional regulator
MGKREYAQSCSLARALDSVGERWSLLVVRELALGPLRFSELARAVGGAPTDVLTRRLRDLERQGIVARRELAPPAAATVYELTELGRGLERPMLELARWGMELQTAADVAGLGPSSLPGALRTILRPPPELAATVGLRSDGQSFALRIGDGWIEIDRDDEPAARLSLAGPPLSVLAVFVVGAEAEDGVEIEGDRELLERLRGHVVVPERLRGEARELIAQLSSVPS